MTNKLKKTAKIRIVYNIHQHYNNKPITPYILGFVLVLRTGEEATICCGTTFGG
jgi:hypothetical protein